MNQVRCVVLLETQAHFRGEGFQKVWYGVRYVSRQPKSKPHYVWQYDRGHNSSGMARDRARLEQLLRVWAATHFAVYLGKYKIYANKRVEPLDLLRADNGVLSEEQRKWLGEMALLDTMQGRLFKQ